MAIRGAGKSLNNSKSNLFSNQLMTVFLILVAMIVVFAVSTRGFFTVNNLYNVLQQISVIGIITVAQAYIIITAGIDLSQGAIIGLTTMISAIYMVDHGWPIWICLILGIIVGLVAGVINGVLVAYLRIPAFIATLGTMSIIEAAALLSKGGNDIYNLPPEIAEFGRSGFGGILPSIALIMIIIAIIMHIILKNTTYGRYIYAVGSNVESANFSGVKVKSVLFRTYVIAGLLCSIAGLVMLFRMNSGVAIAGRNYQMNSIAAVVIGGGSLFGGEGSIVGALIGALIMTILSNGLQIMGVSSYWQQLITGVILIAAVYIDTMRRRKIMG